MGISLYGVELNVVVSRCLRRKLYKGGPIEMARTGAVVQNEDP